MGRGFESKLNSGVYLWLCLRPIIPNLKLWAISSAVGWYRKDQVQLTSMSKRLRARRRLQRAYSCVEIPKAFILR